ncbi:competence/damage-inducible protein A [Clostridium formicaceticum]|uniref:Putative competence-damage inducible protein n=1 Tax=Clostridium formicaceticum TaxID=1497 RepID=A0AAC9WF66_9CLOT|nr:competence/damage-inducible protein A [Clostridium formicaceticum]AOY76039.1 competence/damage-inducible protein A [Clostridium formicaceticum]ARE86398.1 Putative competence-damage inducible protein [Clostridium formicaceticum]
MKAEIIAVGTELLLGDIVNTNAQYIARRLADIGIFVYHQTVVGDNPDRVKKAYEIAFNRADIVITTGGLGPTKDDLTKEIAAEYFQKKLQLDEASLEAMKEYLLRRNHPITEGNKKQAYFPEGAIIVKNDNGTAPGCIIEEDKKTMILLPGPPREMIPMLESQVLPYLSQYQEGTLVSKVLRICGIGESAMEELIEDIMEKQSNPTIAPYAKEGEVILRITAKAQDEDEAEKLIFPVEEQLRSRLQNYIYGEGEVSLEEVVGKMLIDHKLTIATAESCSGGLLAAKIINYPGISSVFMEGVITYSNEAKIQRLGVKPETLQTYGAVSRETAGEMAAGVAKMGNTDIGISITGIAGPTGGTAEKPVGLIYAGLSIKGKLHTKELFFKGDRQKLRNFAATQTLCWLRQMLIEEGYDRQIK